MKIKQKSKSAQRKRLSVFSAIWKTTWFWVSILLTLTILGILYIIFLSPVFVVNAIVVEGDLKELAREEVVSVIRENLSQDILWISSESIFSVSVTRAEQELKNRYKAIESVSFKKRLPKTLSVMVRERIGVARWCADPKEESCVVIDKTGQAFREAREEDNVILLFGDVGDEHNIQKSDTVIEEARLSRVLQIVREGERILHALAPGVNVARVMVQNNRVEQVTSEGWHIIMSESTDLSWQGIKLAAVLEDHITKQQRPLLEYIDLRFGNQAYIRYQD
ncbi:MAG: FtsQ-type POTRA domain-containing protein [bacterium]|nr:FtsQ-type POTRA domain-containing protein [bacterium]